MGSVFILTTLRLVYIRIHQLMDLLFRYMDRVYARDLRAISPREFHIELMFSGRTIREDTFDISEDGRTLLQQSWTPENPNEKDRLVYDKQVAGNGSFK